MMRRFALKKIGNREGPPAKLHVKKELDGSPPHQVGEPRFKFEARSRRLFLATPERG